MVALVGLGITACSSENSVTAPAVLKPVTANAVEITATMVCSNTTTTQGVVNGVFDITPNSEYGNLLSFFSGASWIGPFDNSGQTNVAMGEYTFTTNFTASSGSPMDGKILADNGATVYVNDYKILEIHPLTASEDPVTANFKVPTHFSGAGHLVDGTNVLKVVLYNSRYTFEDFGNSPAGTSYCFTAKTCPAAPAIANAFLREEEGINPTSTRGKEILSLVAKNMGTGASFQVGSDLIDKCSAGYTDAVIDFVSGILHPAS